MRFYGRRKIYIFSIKKIKIFLWVFITFIFLTLVLSNFTKYFINNLKEYVDVYLETYAQNILNQSILEVNKNYNINEQAFVTINTSFSGEPSYIETNTIKLTEYKTLISDNIVKNLNINNKKEIRLNLFNLFGNTIFINKGPEIKITIYPTGGIETNFFSSFKSAGVNQTMHELIFKVKINSKVVFPLGSLSKKTTSEIVVANTVIVGTVPDSYVNVTSDEENLKNDILQLSGE